MNKDHRNSVNASLTDYCSIGEASKRSGISAKMIRYYESTGLIKDVKRTQSNYRYYSEQDVRQLQFLKSARDLGFSSEQMVQLVTLWNDSSRSNVEVKKLALVHVEEIDKRMLELQSMRNALMEMVKQCHGDGKPECPILDGIAKR
ncbi:MAG: Cu(I)-responsive transcriptional regulator [Pseudohongiellaceae bacterium]|nr:Cu(I)-responsive transcriptional regulator [Pseudohongiellaceae bacterium]